MICEAQIRIQLSDSDAFAELSGDFNPMHLDPVVARRHVFGDTVPHGIHVLAAALDRVLLDREGPCRLVRLKANFSLPARHGQPLTVEAEDDGNGGRRVVVRNGSAVLQTVTVAVEDDPGGAASTVADRAYPRTLPRQMTIDEATGLTGQLPLMLSRFHLNRLFPVLAHRLPPGQLACLLATTRLIGMECPGANSVFASLDLVFGQPTAVEGPLAFRVDLAERRMALVRLHLDGPDVSGEAIALFRPPPVIQAPTADISNHVPAETFAGQRALVIGGSRGLGEVAAKLLAAGGAEVWITYRSGLADAAAVVEDLRPFAAGCGLIPFDVTRPPRSLEEVGLPAGWSPTHLYYFATPAIQLGSGLEWQAERFDTYATYYVHGLALTLDAIERLLPAVEQRVLYFASTSFLDAPPPGAAEYVAAKAAGEIVCRSLAAARRGLTAVVPRLPPLRTDQTNSIRRSIAGDPVTVLLETMGPLGQPGGQWT